MRSQDPPRREEHLSFELEPTPNAVAQARDAIRGVELLLSPDLISDIRLMTSELVTNSVRHGDLSEDAHIALRVFVTPTTVRVEVIDPGPGFGADALGPASDGESGWGLFLVDRLAARWGVDRWGHTCVWFEIERLAAGSADSSVSV